MIAFDRAKAVRLILAAFFKYNGQYLLYRDEYDPGLAGQFENGIFSMVLYFRFIV